MNWDEMTSWERNMLVHKHVMGNPGGGIPDYTTDMGVAWQVVRMLNNPDSPAFPDYQDYARFIDALTEIVGSDLFFDLFYCDKDGDHLNPNVICRAALQAHGVEV